MTPQTLLDHCRAAGITLVAEGPNLHYQGPKEVLDDRLIGELAANKPALLDLLRQHGGETRATCAPEADHDWTQEDRDAFERREAELIARGMHPGVAGGKAFRAVDTIARGRALADAASAALPWRKVVAGWPDDRRERWGRRANALEELGHDWRDAERLAFDELADDPG